MYNPGMVSHKHQCKPVLIILFQYFIVQFTPATKKSVNNLQTQKERQSNASPRARGRCGWLRQYQPTVPLALPFAKLPF